MPFITIAGETLIAQKQAAGQVLNIAEFVLANIPGLGVEPPDRVAVLPPVGQIVDTKPVTRSGFVSPNQVVYSLSLDSTLGDYDFNWLGLKSAEGTLVGVAHIPLQQKRKTVGATQGNNLVRNFLLQYLGLQAVTGINVPAATWQIDFTTRLLQIDERERLSNLDDYGAAAFSGDGFKVTLASGTTYNIASGLGYVGGIRCEKATLTALNAGSLPKGIWMDVSLQGDISGVVPVIVFVASATALANNTDELGFKHYLFKIADINAGGAITDLRPGMVVTQAEAEAGISTLVRRWTAQRVKQAFQAFYPNTMVRAELLPGADILLTSNVLKNIVSISLPPGTWDIAGKFTATLGSPPSIVGIEASISTIPDTRNIVNIASLNFGAFVPLNNLQLPIALNRVTVTVTTTFYLVGAVSFNSGTVGGCGYLIALKAP